MAAKKVFNIDVMTLPPASLVSSKISLELNEKGQPAKKDESVVKTLSGTFQEIVSIPTTSDAEKIFGSTESMLKYLISKINSQRKAEALKDLLAAEAGPMAVFEAMVAKMVKAGASEAEISIARSAFAGIFAK